MAHRTVAESVVGTVNNGIIVFHHPVNTHIGHIIYDLGALNKHAAGGTEYKFAKHAFFVFPPAVEVVPGAKSFRCLILFPACRKQFFGNLCQFHRLNTRAGDQPKVILQRSSQLLYGNIVFFGNTALTNDVFVSQSPAAPFIPGIDLTAAAVTIHICKPMKLFRIGILAVHITHPI